MITLGIIGIIAALTLPSIIQKKNEKETVVKLKKVYSVLQQAYLLSINENGGDIRNWGYTKATGKGEELDLRGKFAPYLKTAKICEPKDATCIPNLVYKSSINTPYSNFYEATDNAPLILSDGTLISFNISRSNAKSGAQLYVDLNGSKNPNRLGEDFFYFEIVKDKIVPSGTIEHYGKEYFKNNCLLQNGWACAAWVIINENMDYLRCNDIDWDNKKTCK